MASLSQLTIADPNARPGWEQSNSTVVGCRSKSERTVARILVVEDDLIITMWVEEALLAAGYEVVTVSNADQAIAILESDLKISLVFTDIDMPGTMDGLKLAAAVRARWPPVHLVVASGKHRPHKSEMPARTVFLPKPYLGAEILAAFNEAAQCP
jgi:two-component system, response regulator PdtaR